jgi:hypothetical protein
MYSEVQTSGHVYSGVKITGHMQTECKVVFSSAQTNVLLQIYLANFSSSLIDKKRYYFAKGVTEAFCIHIQ